MIVHSNFNLKTDLYYLINKLNKKSIIELAIYFTKIILLKRKELKESKPMIVLLDLYLSNKNKKNIIYTLKTLLTNCTFKLIKEENYNNNDIDILTKTINIIEYEDKIRNANENYFAEVLTSIIWWYTNGKNLYLNKIRKIIIPYFSKSLNANKYGKYLENNNKESILVLLDYMEDNEENELYIKIKDKWYLNIPFSTISDRNLDSLKIKLRNVIRKDNSLSFRIINYIQNIYSYEESQ